MTATVSGGFTTIQPEMGFATFIKAWNDGSSFIEVATSMLDVIVYRGTCAPLT